MARGFDGFPHSFTENECEQGLQLPDAKSEDPEELEEYLNMEGISVSKSVNIDSWKVEWV